MTEPTRPSPQIDTSVAHSARVWNYWLGGKDHYPADQAAGDAYSSKYPNIVPFAGESRDFLRRTTTFLAKDAGIRQFIDLGAGLPTRNNTHEVAQRIAPDSRVVYIDHDPIVLLHVHALLTSTPEGATAYVQTDMRDTDAVLEGAAKTLDMTKPIALVISDVLGHIVDWDEARGLVRKMVDQLPSGSYLSLSHSTAADEEHQAVQDEYNNSGAIPYVFREPSVAIELFEGTELVEPGFTSWPRWRPDANTGRLTDRAGWGGVARIT
ncbi:SAM-dependent methyltransferase [Streptomyces sp. NBC_01142]|uniref:SAM-dependent methyltransferase n=1 Tax=Streptomyces sp. NBC_01142 TaxID=2975865 RepID=UPI00225B8403|nr:SAM-dependent methyltransferase [Streptomyces sp. NBC_01142]MCX4826414.1 SAM-dependent methyltransferase [Streptomyces sp. NBC_01142]